MNSEEYSMNSTDYMQDGKGRLVPKSNVREIDQLRDELVRDLITRVLSKQEELRQFKTHVFGELRSFVDLSAERFNVKMGGRKGNIQLSTYDGEYKVVIAVNEHINFDERLQVAKELIDQCITKWREGSRPEMQALINDAFYVDKQGQVSIARILGLRRLEIDDAKWRQAMEAITESIQVVSSKEYIRFYKRTADNSWHPITLDFAAL